MGLSFTYDEKILEPLPASSWSWEVKGTIKNFDVKKGRAVWATGETIVLHGDICVMAFRVLEDAKLTRTKVSCELIVKNQGDEVGIYTAEGMVGQRCEHEYGPWDSQDNLWHTAECKQCGKKLTQSHTWDDGVEKSGADGKRVRLFTCTVCRSEKEVVLSGISTGTKPTESDGTEHTVPTVPNNDHDHSVKAPTNSPVHEDGDGEETVPNGGRHEDQDHQNADNDQQTAPENDDGDIIADPTQEHVHEHDHDVQSINGSADPITGIVVAVVVIALIGGAVYFVKRR